MKLVTGANGFIGSHLCNFLSQKNCPFRALVHGDSIQPVPNATETIAFDLKAESFPDRAFHAVDTVIHLAAIARNQDNLSPSEYVAVNVEGTRKLLQAAKRHGVKRFIFISTIEATGFSDGINPLTEASTPRPVNIYGQTKLDAEKLVLSFQSAEFDIVVLRLSLIYGPNNYLNVPKLFRAVQKSIMPVIGSGRGWMEFTFVENACHGIWCAMNSPQAAGQLFFLTDGSIRVINVLKAVARGSGSNPFWLHIPIPIAWLIGCLFELTAKVIRTRPITNPLTGKPVFSRLTVEWSTKSLNWCSNAKIRELIGYSPTNTLEQGIAKTVDDFAKRRWIRQPTRT